MFPSIINLFSELATDTHVKLSDRDDQQHNSIGVVAVVHQKKGAYGGSDLMKKPNNKKNGASNLPAVNTLGGITFSVFMMLVLLV